MLPSEKIGVIILPGNPRYSIYIYFIRYSYFSYYLPGIW